MDIFVHENTKTKMVFEIDGADRTACNAIKQELWNDDKVKIAGFNIAHPLIGKPEMTVETKAKKPVDSLTDAVKRVKKDIAKVKKDFAKLK